MVYYHEYAILAASHVSTPPSVLRMRGRECHEMAEPEDTRCCREVTTEYTLLLLLIHKRQ